MALHSTVAAVTKRIRQHGPVGVPQAAAQRAARITALGQDDRPVGRVIDDRAIVNGIIGLLATGSSTHHTLHLVAIKRRAGLHAMGDPITFIKFLKVTPRFFQRMPIMSSSLHERPLSSWRAKLHEIIFEADTPAGKAFDVGLIVCIVLSTLCVMLDSMRELRTAYGATLNRLEWGLPCYSPPNTWCGWWRCAVRSSTPPVSMASSIY